MNTPYYGDNLQVLRDHVPDASVDLIIAYPRLGTRPRSMEDGIT